MDKVRVCDLAKKYGIPSKELITFLNDNNYEVKAAQSSVDALRQYTLKQVLATRVLQNAVYLFRKHH